MSNYGSPPPTTKEVQLFAQESTIHSKHVQFLIMGVNLFPKEQTHTQKTDHWRQHWWCVLTKFPRYCWLNIVWTFHPPFPSVLLSQNIHLSNNPFTIKNPQSTSFIILGDTTTSNIDFRRLRYFPDTGLTFQTMKESCVSKLALTDRRNNKRGGEINVYSWIKRKFVGSTTIKLCLVVFKRPWAQTRTRQGLFTLEKS